MHAPIYSHWATFKPILRYLKGTTSYSFHTTHSSSFDLYGFINVDWAGSIDDKKIYEWLPFFLWLDANFMEVMQAMHICSLL